MNSIGTNAISSTAGACRPMPVIATTKPSDAARL
jgi:hypothetical protein